MALHPQAGKPASFDQLVDIPRLLTAYFTERPDPAVAAQRVVFGTSGHRGSAFHAAFNEHHILAMTQAIIEYRKSANIEGPLFIGRDTHALSTPAFATALEVLAGHGVETVIEQTLGPNPTPVISHAILTHNQTRSKKADGIVITPSHNPPEDGGFKYNPPHGGPAGSEVTDAIAKRANQLLLEGLSEVKRVSYRQALTQPSTHHRDLIHPYVSDLAQVIDLDLIRDAKVNIGVDPLGGSSVAYWGPIAERYGLRLEVVNPRVDPTFGFMTLDKDGKIRMDCSSPYAMANLVKLKDRFDVAFGHDCDSDRHGIVCPSVGLMNPNHYLAVAIHYLFTERAGWPQDAKIGKTLVSSAIIDRVAQQVGRPLAEVPVGFKWFVEGLLDGSFGFGGEESAGASFLRKNGTTWTTDKDGPVLGLLAAEMVARKQKDPGEMYQEITKALGAPVYARIDAPATPEQKAVLKKLSPVDVQATTLAGDPIIAKRTRAPENGAAIGGLKVSTDHGWFAARPSGTENVYKVYAESFRGPDHLAQIQEEAQHVVKAVFQAAGV